jgi:hypothetical protein
MMKSSGRGMTMAKVQRPVGEHERTNGNTDMTIPQSSVFSHNMEIRLREDYIIF